MDLNEIHGIGEAYEERLNDAGIHDVEDLAGTNPASEVPGVPQAQLEEFVQRARNIAEHVPTAPDPTEAQSPRPNQGSNGQAEEGFLTRMWNKLRNLGGASP